MPAWDKWEVLLFNTKVLHMVTLPAGTGFQLLWSRGAFPHGRSPSTTGSVLWTEMSAKATGSLSALMRLLSEKGGLHLKGTSVPTEGQSLFWKGILVGGLVAGIGTLTVVQGTSSKTKLTA